MTEGGKNNNSHKPSVNFSNLKTIYYWEFSVFWEGTLNNQQRNIKRVAPFISPVRLLITL